jgi:hypothetical protein
MFAAMRRVPVHRMATLARSKHTNIRVEDGIAIVSIDCVGEKQNVLSEELMTARRRLAPAAHQLACQPAPCAGVRRECRADREGRRYSRGRAHLVQARLLHRRR